MSEEINNPESFGSRFRHGLSTFWRSILIILVTLLVTFSGLFVWQNFFGGKTISQQQTEQQGDSFTVTVDKTAIIQEIQAMERLETVRQVIQRDITVTIDLGDLEVFGISILENKRIQEFTITGYVLAGIDLEQVKAEDITVSEDQKEVQILLPAPKIFDANLIEDQTRIIREDITVLYNLETLNNDRRKELNEKLFQLVLTESRMALVQAACDDDILVKAQDNSAESMQKLFGRIMSDNFYIQTTTASSCELAEI